jgi:hypothetical protein
MKNLFLIAALAALTTGTAYAGDCAFPSPPEKIPDGRTATRQEMVDGKTAVTAYDKAINAYTTCLQQERDSRFISEADHLTAEQKAQIDRVLVERHNAAIDTLQSVADRFNEQLRIFNARGKS